MTWTFRRMSRSEMNADPIEGEFFTPEGLVDSLVRESIQNSLDARKGPEAPVEVSFHLFNVGGKLSADRAKKYMDGLWSHLAAIESGRPNLPTQDDAMSYLVVEDFGTRGLCGPVDQATDEESQGAARRVSTISGGI
jgi:hypothetical protein